VSLDRITTAFEKIADALTRLAVVEERKFPPEKERRAAEIIRSDENKELLSDKGTPDWFAETEAATGPSRFQQRLDETRKAEPERTSEPKRRRVATVRERDGSDA